MKRARVTTGGQVSLPAEVRRRWNTRVVAIEDLGDSVLVRPLPDDPVGAARGALRGRLPATSALRAAARRADAEAAGRR